MPGSQAGQDKGPAPQYNTTPWKLFTSHDIIVHDQIIVISWQGKLENVVLFGVYGESHSKGCPYEGEMGECQAGRLSPGQSSGCDLFALTHCILIMAHLSKVWLSHSLLKHFLYLEYGLISRFSLFFFCHSKQEYWIWMIFFKQTHYILTLLDWQVDRQVLSLSSSILKNHEADWRNTCERPQYPLASSVFWVLVFPHERSWWHSQKWN